MPTRETLARNLRRFLPPPTALPRLARSAILAALLLLALLGCNHKTPEPAAPARSGTLTFQCCAAFQHSDSLTDQPPPGVTRLAIGGDARNDTAGVLPWAFGQARRRGATAFFFLGDLELTRSLDKLIAPQLANLGGLPFYPLMGNHEVEFLGILRVPGTSKHAVKEFKEDFLTAPGIKLAPLDDIVAYSVDLGDNIHWIALDNVSRRHEGFGKAQHDWLAADLQAASAAHKTILVGMHKGLADNPVTTHAMTEDGDSAIADSREALKLFKQFNVAMVFVSHSHMFAAYDQDGIPIRLTGGLGAPLVKGLGNNDGGFHHVLLVDVAKPGGNPLVQVQVEVVKFGTAVHDDKDETEEVEQ